VALAVGATSRGAAAIVTINLAIGVGRMPGATRSSASLSPVEASGSTTVICLRKPHSHQNRMTVREIYAEAAWA